MKTKAIILAAGQGTRMKSPLPKVLHPICGRPMIQRLLDTVQKADIDETIVVIGPDADAVKEAVKPIQTVVQQERLGTAHAVLAARDYLDPFDGCVMILFGDSPLITVQTLNQMKDCCLKGADVVVLGFIPTDARRYGRLVMGEDGLDGIVEYKDATDTQRSIRLCNSGVMCVNGRFILQLLQKVDNKNASSEYYLTDIVAIAKKLGLKRDVVIGDVDELHGINTPEELATAEEIFKKKQGEIS